MKISTRGRYSLRFMIDLAQHYSNEFITLKDVSARQNISKKYLEQIIPFLNRQGLLISNKGHQGGYRLAHPPKEITVKEVFLAAEGSLAPVSCMDNCPNQCEQQSSCLTLPIYQGLHKVILDYLDGITLQTIIEQNNSDSDFII